MSVNFRRIIAATLGLIAVVSLPGCSNVERLEGLRQVSLDGGESFYSRFTTPIGEGAGFFPLGIWYSDVSTREDVATDLGVGINLYTELSAGSNFAAVSEAPISVLNKTPIPLGRPTSGWLVDDETDLYAGEGYAGYAGSYGSNFSCIPVEAKCGFTVLDDRIKQLPTDGKIRYANYSKAALMYVPEADARKFLNEYQDVVSVDAYWFSDPDICGAYQGGEFVSGKAAPLPETECRAAVNYGRTIEAVRGKLTPAGARPVWAIVEVGYPFEKQDRQIAPDEIRAAVWHSIIAGARGVIYFDHSFGGQCKTLHSLRSDCYAEANSVVAKTNRQIEELGIFLNSPEVQNLVEVSGGVKASVRRVGSEVLVMAASDNSPSGSASIKVACRGVESVSVLGEGRTLELKGDSFQDDFPNGNSVHLYEFDLAGKCE